LAGIHGQPVVVVRVDESLRDEAMDLNRVVQKFELLCLQRDLAGLETQIHKDQAENSPVHTASLVVDREIGTRTQHNAATKAWAEALLPRQGDSVLLHRISVLRETPHF
jgi:hypothetical protein